MLTLIRIFRLSFQYKWILFGALACAILAPVLSLAIPRLLGTSIDLALQSGSATRLIVPAIAILLVAVLRGIVMYGHSYLGEALSQRIAYDLRNSLFAKLLDLSFSFYDRQKTGDLMSKATVDIDGTRQFINLGIIRIFYLVILLVSVTILLVLIDWMLALIGLGAVVLAAFLSIFVSRALRRIWLWIHQQTGTLTILLQENLTGARVVRAFGAQAYEQDRFNAQARRVAEGTYDALHLHAFAFALLGLLFAIVTALVLWFGGQNVLNGELTVGELTQFILYVGLVIAQAPVVGWIVNSFARAIACGERVFGVLDTATVVNDRPHAKAMDRATGHVRFENVSFAYDGQAAAVRDISFEAQAGQKVALLGAPGSGKTTVVHLLPRFYDATSGRITIDGLDVQDATLASLRHNIGLVFQDVFLFSATIHDNIAFGISAATREQVVAVARAAQLHDFIASLPNGYDTLVGERGVSLSGGQRQRLAIARTLLMDPPVLVLDDSTSSVDPETERLLQQALATVMEGRTTFIIAHRLSSVMLADLILVLKDGRISERGTHQHLLEQGGLYRQIYELQLLPQGRGVPAETPADGN